MIANFHFVALLSLFTVSLAWTSTPSSWTHPFTRQATTTKTTYLNMAADETSSSTSSVPKAEIIGAGRIGSLLAQAGNCIVLARQDSISADPSMAGVPILISTRNDALDGIVDKCPDFRKPDLVFLQNGYLDNFLESKGLLDNTQALLYLSVTAKGVKPIDGITTVNPEGLTASTGVHAKPYLIDWLHWDSNVAL